MKLPLLCMLFLVNLMNAQKVLLTGVIRDELNDPIYGVSIYLKSTYQGTISNEEGEFKIFVNKDVDNITFSYLGYKTMDLQLGQLISPSNLSVKLIPEDQMLETIFLSTVSAPELLERVIKKSKDKLKESIILTTYNKEILKTDSSYCYFAEGKSNYHLKSKGKKVKTKMHVEESRVLSIGCEDKRFLKSNPFGYHVEDIVEDAFKKNRLLKMVFKSKDTYEFTLKSKTINKNNYYNIIEFEPKEDNLDGYLFKGYVIYDSKSELILETYIKKASSSLNNAFKLESFLLTFSAIDEEQKTSYRIEENQYLLVYSKSYQKYYVRNILASRYDKTYSFYNEVTALNYQEGYFKLKRKDVFKDDYLFYSGNKYKKSFWEEISITESNQEKLFKEAYQKRALERK